jgi:hypothetical protein
MAAKYITYTGSHNLDLVPLQGKLYDIEEGGLQGFRTDQSGFPSVVLILAEAMPQYGAAAGVPQDVYDHFVMCNDAVGAIDARLVIALKQVEVLRESRAFYVDARQNDIGLMVDAMRSRAQRRKDPALLVPFEQVIKYNGQIGVKSVQTRRKNKQAKEAKAAQQAAMQPPAAPSEGPPAPV